MDKKVVFDFDKTLVNINTFPLWIIFILSYSLLRFDFKINFLNLLYQRKISKIISHDKFKKLLLQENLEQIYYEKFSNIIFRLTNQRTINALLKLESEGYLIAISSAAPEDYLKVCINKIFPNNNFIIIGANITSGIFTSNYKNEKYANLMKKGFISPKEKLAYFFTDSFDDFPLAQFSNKVILVNPDRKTYQKFIKEFKNEVSIL